MTLAYIQDYQLPQIPPEQYIMFLHDDINWGWTHAEINTFTRLWKKGVSIWEIAEKMERDPDESVLLAIALCRDKRIRRRPGGMWGG
jgi:hypothetical protein